MIPGPKRGIIFQSWKSFADSLFTYKHWILYYSVVINARCSTIEIADVFKTTFLIVIIASLSKRFVHFSFIYKYIYIYICVYIYIFAYIIFHISKSATWNPFITTIQFRILLCLVLTQKTLNKLSNSLKIVFADSPCFKRNKCHQHQLYINA